MPFIPQLTQWAFWLIYCKKLDQQEFNKWYSLFVANVEILHKNLRKLKNKNTILIMGDEDHIFYKSVKKDAIINGIKLSTIKNCGHVCNMEKSKEFNNIMMEFLIPSAA